MQLIRSDEYIRHEENITLLRQAASQPEPGHTHEFIEIVYTLSGKCDHYVDGVCYPVGRGDLLFINFGQVHSFCPIGATELVNCLITPEFIDKELINSENALELLALSSFADFEGSMDKLVPKVSFRGRELIEVEALIEAMFLEFYDKQTNYRTALKGHMLVFLTKIFRQMQSADRADILQHVNRLAPDLLRYIEENCYERISLHELAHKCFYNPSYFSRVFKECYGKSLMVFINEKRMNEAIRLLKETGQSVETISRSVGYNDRKQFYKIFKQYAGMTPSAVRSTFKK